MSWQIGIDVGGTFSDLVAIDQKSGEVRAYKHPSMSEDPVAPIQTMFNKHNLLNDIAPTIL